MAKETEVCPEILDKIFSFLSLEDLLTAAQADPRWNAIAQLSFRRRINLKPFDTSRSYSTLKMDRWEPYGSSKKRQKKSTLTLIEGLEEEELHGHLYVDVDNDVHPNLPLLALFALPDACCAEFTSLHINSLHTRLAAQDWNIAVKPLLHKFPSLQELQLGLQWLANYKSSLEIPERSSTNPDSLNLEQIDIRFTVTDETPVDCTLNHDFVARCPELKTWNVSFHESAYMFEFKYNNDATHQLTITENFIHSWWEERYHAGELVTRNSPFYVNALTPMLNALPLIKIHFQQSLYLLEHFGAKTIENLKALSVDLSSELQQPILVKFQLLFNILHKRTFFERQDLQLYWLEEDDNLEVQTTNTWNELIIPPLEIELQQTFKTLENIKRLEVLLDMCALGKSDAGILKRIVYFLPNVELAVMRTCFCHEFFYCRTRVRGCSNQGCSQGFGRNQFAYEGRFLEVTAKWKQLRHLVCHWVFSDQNPLGPEALAEIEKHLALHQTLESMTIILAGDGYFSALEAAVRGCAALPRMRLFQVLVDADSMLGDSPRFKALQSKARNYHLRLQKRVNHPDGSCSDFSKFQIAFLDHFCGQL